MELLRTNSTNPDFTSLVQKLDAELAEIDGDEHDFYAKLNKVDGIRHVIVVYENGTPISCGAIKEFSTDAMEVKRMYTLKSHRGQGLATITLTELEKWAAELNYNKCVLETGIRQPDAIALYKKNGYRQIPNYGKYVGIENSVCFEKTLAPAFST